MRITVDIDITDPDIAESYDHDPLVFEIRVQKALAAGWPYAGTTALRVLRISRSSPRTGRPPGTR
jgi:hypothetical protein